jgi:hypothetical protein
MCDRSHLDIKAGRFDKTLVETYRGPTNVETAPVKPNEDAQGLPLNRFGEKIDYTIYCP